MTQTAGAFGRVESALTFFIARYQSLASYKAVVERLTTFRSAIAEARSLARNRRASNALSISDVIWCCVTLYCVCRMGGTSYVPTG
jgi:putative ATP-binding cassette transporter